MTPKNEKKILLVLWKNTFSFSSPVFRRPKYSAYFVEKNCLALAPKYTTKLYRCLSRAYRYKRLNKMFLEDVPKIDKITEKKFRHNTSEKKPKCFCENSENQFLLFHQSDGIGALFRQQEPRNLEKSSTWTLANHFSNFFRHFFWQRKFFGGRKLYGMFK